ncbi:MAG TPA: hypothetical protein VKB19_11220 [Pedobacter sp.]|nr:hypothetical protein [Pedobacter sp.]
MMNTEENENNGSLLSSQEPHQKEEMDQATRASAGSFTLEPEKGITPQPEAYNKGDKQGNVKQPDHRNTDDTAASDFDPVNEVDPDADDTAVTEEDLRALDGEDADESTM